MSRDLPSDDPINITAQRILDAGFKIHRQYGPGLLESAYEHLLFYELIHTFDLKVERQKMLPITHEGQKIDAGYRLDLIVNEHVIVELKCVEKMLPIHEAQLITYLKLSKIKLGLILNFNVPLFKNGIRRLIV